jgi:hypothetical protein
MEQIIYEIKGIKYVLFSLQLPDRNEGKEMVNTFRKMDAIIQSYEVVETFWAGKSIKAKVLIPEEFAHLFSDIQML